MYWKETFAKRKCSTSSRKARIVLDEALVWYRVTLQLKGEENDSCLIAWKCCKWGGHLERNYEGKRVERDMYAVHLREMHKGLWNWKDKMNFTFWNETKHIPMHIQMLKHSPWSTKSLKRHFSIHQKKQTKSEVFSKWFIKTFNGKILLTMLGTSPVMFPQAKPPSHHMSLPSWTWPIQVPWPMKRTERSLQKQPHIAKKKPGLNHFRQTNIAAPSVQQTRQQRPRAHFCSTPRSRTRGGGF